MKRSLFFLILTLILSTAFATHAGDPVPIGEVFTLGVDQSTEVGPQGLVVGFKGVVSDSRCPMDAYCIWEGDAAAALWADGGPGELDAFMLHTSLLFDTSYDIQQYRIVLLGVAPYPMSTGGLIDPETYEVTLLVVETGATSDERATWGMVKSLYE